jgi:hypothetical protein
MWYHAGVHTGAGCLETPGVSRGSAKCMDGNSVACNSELLVTRVVVKVKSIVEKANYTSLFARV